MTFRRLKVRQIQRIPLVGTVVRRIAAVPFVVKIVRAVQKTRLAARCGGGDRLAVHLNLPAGTPPRSAGIVNAAAEVDDNTPLCWIRRNEPEFLALAVSYLEFLAVFEQHFAAMRSESSHNRTHSPYMPFLHF